MTDDSTKERSAEDKILGQKMREIRNGKKIPLKRVAEKAGVSESFISQVERGIVSPSVASLRRICDALGITVSSLFYTMTEARPSRLVKVNERRMNFRPDGSEHFLLTPEFSSKLQVNQSTVPPGYTSGEEPYTHGGDEECIHVVSGKLTVDWATETFELDSGDAVLIDPKIGHRFHNRSEHSTTVLWIISPALGDI